MVGESLGNERRLFLQVGIRRTAELAEALERAVPPRRSRRRGPAHGRWALRCAA
jgi:hypothetical protein